MRTHEAFGMHAASNSVGSLYATRKWVDTLKLYIFPENNRNILIRLEYDFRLNFTLSPTQLKVTATCCNRTASHFGSTDLLYDQRFRWMEKNIIESEKKSIRVKRNLERFERQRCRSNAYKCLSLQEIDLDNHPHVF